MSNVNVSSVNSSSKSPHNNEDSYKYKLETCQSNIDKHDKNNENSDNPETKDWLNLEKQISHDSEEYTLFNAFLIEKKKSIVVKIGPELLLEEYKIGEILEDKIRLPIFIGFYCIFNCLDDFQRCKTKSKDEQIEINKKRRDLCKKNGNKINVLVMPYISGNHIQNIKWKIDELNILKNIMIHIIISLIYAYTKIGFIHGDLHLGNVILQKTKRKNITYGEFGNIEIHGGIMPIIMDYGKSNLDVKNPDFLYEDIKRIISLICSESNLVCDSLNFIIFIKSLQSKKTPITTEICKLICNHIDDIKCNYDRTNIPQRPAWLSGK